MGVSQRLLHLAGIYYMLITPYIVFFEGLVNGHHDLVSVCVRSHAFLNELSLKIVTS